MRKRLDARGEAEAKMQAEALAKLPARRLSVPSPARTGEGVRGADEAVHPRNIIRAPDPTSLREATFSRSGERSCTEASLCAHSSADLIARFPAFAGVPADALAAALAEAATRVDDHLDAGRLPARRHALCRARPDARRARHGRRGGAGGGRRTRISTRLRSGALIWASRPARNRTEADPCSSDHLWPPLPRAAAGQPARRPRAVRSAIVIAKSASNQQSKLLYYITSLAHNTHRVLLAHERLAGGLRRGARGLFSDGTLHNVAHR